MTIYKLHNITADRRQKRLLLTLSFFIFHLSFSVAQTITIAGNVYGGGNVGEMTGNTRVTICAGDIKEVYGGARQANVGGSAIVNIDGEHASDYIIINRVFGGNDIAGTVGETENTSDKYLLRAVANGTKLTAGKTYYTSKDGDGEFTAVGSEVANGSNYYELVLALASENGIDNTWDACVRTSTKITPAVYYTQEEINEATEGDPAYGKTTSDIKTPAGVADDNQKIFIGQLFGGGNGDYTYETREITTTTDEGTTTVTKYVAKKGDVEVATSDNKLKIPEIAKSYLEVCGGTIGFAYGGGNNATVTKKDIVCVDNPSDVVNSIIDPSNPAANTDDSAGPVGELLNDARFEEMGIHIGGSHPSSGAFQMGWVFGGNNKADMSIIPKWNLKSGSIRNLYSGGNAGRMTSKTGILLEIMADSRIVVDNVFGGCRKANVQPLKSDGTDQDHVSNPEGYKFPEDLAARTLIRGGDINNVYGGNDISGKVYFGNAVGIYTSIRGNVYGGGNGSYAYTDNPKLKDDPIYGEYYYDPKEVLGSKYSSIDDKLKSVTALDLFRPNAEQVSLRVAGTSKNTPTIIHGSIFVGGNSATLEQDPDKLSNSSYKNYPLVELKVGSHVIADKVFLGNNGEYMIKSNVADAEHGIAEGVLRTFKSAVTGSEKPFNSMDLTDAAVFSKYMDGAALDLMPRVVFDNTTLGDPADYTEYSSYFGSFFCGGNVGSMTKAGTTTIPFNHKVVIFDKLVGGCNTAVVPAVADINAEYVGGIIGAEDERDVFTEDGQADGNIKDRLVLNFSGLKIQPKRWKVNPVANGLLIAGTKYYTGAYGTGAFTANGTEVADGTNYFALPELEWNTVDKDGKQTPPIEALQVDGTPEESTDADINRRFEGGNIYGGCYSSGVVNGNVVININGTIVDRGKKDEYLEPGEIDYGVFDGIVEEEEDEDILYTHDKFNIYKRRSGVILNTQGMDVLGKALNVFGGGKGAATEIWGSTTINLNEGYMFQLFGGSEEGVIGRSVANGDYTFTYTNSLDEQVTKTYTYDPRYSCYVNLKGTMEGVTKKGENDEAMSECEFMYGGGFFGPIAGNTVINLGNGRIFNSFAGSCNADILGHAETYVGRQIMDDKDTGGTDYSQAMSKWATDDTKFKAGFPWVRDIVYGGNDLGGLILSEVSFKNRVRTDDETFNVLSMVHNPGNKDVPDVVKASAYVEYLQGRADGIFGGAYGTYDYTDPKFDAYTYTATKNEKGDVTAYSTGADASNLGTARDGFNKPFINNAFVNFRPTYYHKDNRVKKVYGAGQGQSGDVNRDEFQNRSYVLIDIPMTNDFKDNFTSTEVFGAGAWGGVGMKYTYDETMADGFDLDRATAVIDLLRGNIKAAYGGSYKEGVTRRTLVNVPENSTIEIQDIFGGAYGVEILPPCDVYESHVNYRNTSENARVKGAIYGGNNKERRTLYATVNISSPVWSDKSKGYLATVYGAGRGVDTWAEYTEVNLNNGAWVDQVYGGGEMGHVLNAESVQMYMQTYKGQPSNQISEDDANWSDNSRWNTKTVDGKTIKESLKDVWKDAWARDWKKAWSLGDYYSPNANYDNYIGNTRTNLNNTATDQYSSNGLLVRKAGMDDRDYTGLSDAEKAKRQYLYNTNVIINQGATVERYAYGGGLGEAKTPMSGDIYGSTYIALLGGTVKRDLYAAGTSGSIDDLFNVGALSSSNPTGFTASANVYVKGGSCRNVYGGGWEGSVGYHAGEISDPWTGDRLGETHVVIGDADGSSFTNGIPTVQRNAYGGGEGGAVFGTTNVKIYKGYIGYTYNTTTGKYEEKIDDETWTDHVGLNRLYDSGCVFGGGYIDNSNVDYTNIKMYDGTVRNSIYGGGEIAAVGRGECEETGEDNKIRTLKGIYKGGKTFVELFNGHVLRNVFGGGRGYNNLGQIGHLHTDGYVFGQTDVHVHGGEVGTEEGMALGHGNVFGGGDVGYVYSAYEYEDNGVRKLGRGMKSGNRYDDGKEGYYYRHKISSTGTFDDDNGFERDNNEYILTEDCKVLVEPHCRVKSGKTVTLTNVLYPKDCGIPDCDLKYLKAQNPNRTDIDENGKVTAENGITIAERTYSEGDYISTYALNTLGAKSDSRWSDLFDDGIIIHNAVFAGGNVTEGSDQIYADATTVYGNATASIHDVYHRDLITIGTGHTGGLYGDGNLTFVDGYRGLNITNYGTDFYHITMEIGIDVYRNLPPREQAYYELRYSCLRECTDRDGKTYSPANGNIKASTLTADELLLQFEGITTPEGTPMIDASGKPNELYWEENGVCSRYAGRIMNTIQRADFCGVFGSRMVMQGAEDRVPEEVDHTLYTINRVREVSLNKKLSVAGDTDDNKSHGNYFGIYNIVHHLGALTSDVDFDAVRTTGNKESQYLPDNDTQTFSQWKAKHIKDRTRNNGTSHNQVALASGVYLELTTEKSWGKAVTEKDWGLITGVVELDLINVQPGVGGGFVYAKNEHGVRSKTNRAHITLTALNRGAVTSDDFSYNPDDTKKTEWETSGNFVHDTQVIIDDCYPESNRYKKPNAVLAHYWYIKGQVYVYDQYISAYTGAPSAYSRVEYIPLTITAASHGEMKLINVMPNYYAYYSHYNNASDNTKLNPNDELAISEKIYKLNDPISYWDYNLLSATEKKLFVNKTYVTVASCKIGDDIYPAGYVLLESELNGLENIAVTQTIDGVSQKAVQKVVQDENGNYEVVKNDNGEAQYEAFNFVFRESNNMSHDTGYMLTYDVTNPKIWDKWYTPLTTPLNGTANTSKITTEAYKTSTEQDNYNNGPTYSPTGNGLYGQHDYNVADIIPKAIYDTYQSNLSYVPSSGQASFEEAFVVTKEMPNATKVDNSTIHLNVGATVVKSDYYDNSDPNNVIDHWTEMVNSGNVDEAYVCTSTIKLGENNYIYLNQLMSEAEKDDYISHHSDHATDISALVKPAYYCTTAGLYGGDYYETTKNYRGLEAWSSMSESDRANFTFNYDALDLLIDPNYSWNEAHSSIIHPEGQKYQYDGKDFDEETDVRYKDTQGNWVYGNKAGYSVTQPVDYTATYEGASEMELTKNVTVKRGDSTTSTNKVQKDDELDREAYESLPNEKRHYAPISVDKGGGVYYVVKTAFIQGETPYAVGQVVEAETYNRLVDNHDNIVTLTFGADSESKDRTYYFCRESYKVGHNGEGVDVSSTNNVTGAEVSGSYTNGQEVPVGLVIDEGKYTSLANRQLNFAIHGVAPIETSTLYVSRESDIYDLSKEKIITVIYQYDYEESDEEGMHITPVSERHVVNIHILFESGVPEVEDINAPKIVLPGTEVSLRTPNVKPGAYEVTGGGWTLFKKYADTESHINGIDFTPKDDPLYWYQDGYWVAYYAKTYLGRTYSNAVQVSVANYHDLADVMSDKNKEHHMYIDNPEVKRDPKIYINDYSKLKNTEPNYGKNGLDELKRLFDLSLLDDTKVDTDPTTGLITTVKNTSNDSPFKGHALMNTTQVGAGANLEFFLRTDIDYSKEWESIGTEACFQGTVHGDGHTIRGLDHSLFNRLCGDVYNLGVTGTFTGAGIAETGDGYVENCWIKTDVTPTTVANEKHYPVFGNPLRQSGNAKGTVQVVNCYYPASNVYTAADANDIHGRATQMPDRAFYNGEVTYDLNGFYLNKRYYDNNTTWAGTKKEYSYLASNADGSLPADASAGNYPDSYTSYTPKNVTARPAPDLGYVEHRFYDGDFRYAGGFIPDDDDARQRQATVSVTTGEGSQATTTQVETNLFYPIWPDDYLFFGQALNYGHMDGENSHEARTHQPLPAVINKASDRLLTTVEGNRVYRAPAYFRSKQMGVAHFNPYAVFAQSEKGNASNVAYKDMTAIDFTGSNGDVSSGYQSGFVKTTPYSYIEGGAFFPPLLDDGGLQDFYNADLTRNLLVYTMTETPAAMQTDGVVATKLPHEDYVETETAPANSTYSDTYRYHTVKARDVISDKIRGHWVQKQGENDFMAVIDHALVDKQDFNAPISYYFAAEKRMWYQRKPENYVGKKKPDNTFIANNAGWDAISLPFKAEIVTTDVKGEITHFYNYDNSNKEDIGHEYWLRRFVEGGTVDGNVYKAKFKYPDYNTDDGEKVYSNTFLWDYYYSYNNYDDLNKDDYQERDDNRDYYRYEHKYTNYPRLAAATPYIIGFPGERYYEFDLSGNFWAETALSVVPVKLKQQAITFASKPGATIIGVSDDEMNGVSAGTDYTFKPSYLNKTFDANTPNTYTLNGNGDSYDLIPSDAGVTVNAFRPYFVKSGNSSRQVTRSIVFADGVDDLAPYDTHDSADEQGGIIARPGRHKIMVSSTLKNEAEMRIVNAAGQTLTTFTLQPGETHETRIINAGVYIVQSTNGHYIRKVAVR